MNKASCSRRSWRDNWLSSIYEFANPRLQRASWIEGPSADWPDGEPWLSSFSECMCGYFDDLALGEGYEPRVREGLLSEREAAGALRFHTRAELYQPKSNSNGSQMLKDPDWQAVVHEAVVLWNTIKRETSDPQDLATIKNLETRFGVVD